MLQFLYIAFNCDLDALCDYVNQIKHIYTNGKRNWSICNLIVETKRP